MESQTRERNHKKVEQSFHLYKKIKQGRKREQIKKCYNIKKVADTPKEILKQQIQAKTQRMRRS